MDINFKLADDRAFPRKRVRDLKEGEVFVYDSKDPNSYYVFLGIAGGCYVSLRKGPVDNFLSTVTASHADRYVTTIGRAESISIHVLMP